MKRVFLVGVVTTCLAACGAKGFGDPPSTEPAAMRALVAQLIAASGTTNAVPFRDALMKDGPAALPALREALARTGGIPFDTARILRALAMELGGLKSGAVVRGHATDPTSSGITDGDVVVREGPHEVQSRADIISTGLDSTMARNR